MSADATNIEFAAEVWRLETPELKTCLKIIAHELQRRGECNYEEAAS